MTKESQPRLTPEQQQKLDEYGDWVIQTCLMFGAEPVTAYNCAAAFVEGVTSEWLKPVSQNS